MLSLKATLVALVVSLTTVIAQGAEEYASQARANWHQWRGPLSTGVAPEANPPVEWDESKNIKWKVPVPGESTATPIIWGDKVFIATAVQTDKTVQTDTTAEP